MFSVTQATVPDEMPVHSEVSPSAYIYNIQSTVQNASQITITVNPTGAASVQDFLDIQNPAFDDSGTSEEISSFPEFLDTVKSKMNFFQFFRNLKAGLQFVLHVGSIVNNCVTDNPNLPLSAAQGKALQDQLATLNSNLAIVSSCISNVYIKKIANEGEYTQVFATSIIDSSHFCGLVIADGGLYSFHNIGNVTALVNRSTYKVVCSNAGNLARLSITGMGTWDECVIISNRDFTLTHK